MWARTVQTYKLSHLSSFVHPPRTRAQKHKALVSSHRTDIQGLAHELIYTRSRMSKEAHCTKPWWASTVQRYWLSHISSSAHAPIHEHRSTPSHTRAHSRMLPPTSGTRFTREHCTGTISLYTHIAQRSCGRALPRSPHSHAQAHVHVPLAQTCLHARIARRRWTHTTQKHMLPHTSHTGSCTGTVRGTDSTTHVAPNVALSRAHMLGLRGRIRILPQHMPIFTRAV